MSSRVSPRQSSAGGSHAKRTDTSLRVKGKRSHKKHELACNCVFAFCVSLARPLAQLRPTRATSPSGCFTSRVYFARERWVRGRRVTSLRQSNSLSSSRTASLAAISLFR